MLRVFLSDLREFKWHVLEIFRLLRTGQFGWDRPGKKFFGPRYDWYDGPHYAFGFIWFCIYSDDFKDRAPWRAKGDLVRLLKKLLAGRARYEK